MSGDFIRCVPGALPFNRTPHAVACAPMDSTRIYSLAKRKQYLYCLVSVIAVACFCSLLPTFIGYRVVALILLFAVSLLAITFDILPVLLSAALSAFIWDFFFIPPRFTLHVDTTEDTILLIMYFVIAMINGVLTARIRRAEKMARIKEERAASVKLYNTILDSLSHELRTPIAAIIGATDNLQWNKNLSPGDRQQLVEEISKASLRLNQQVENLLNISRLESGHVQPKSDWCDVVELVHDVVKSVEDNHRQRKINISVNQNLPLCRIDEGILQQVLYNLLNNAAIHTAVESKIEIAATVHTDRLEFIVEDSGTSLGETARKELLRKFSRDAIRATDRSGLGLSIVKGFTEALSGSVELTRGDLGGAKFILVFPVKTSFLKVQSE